MIRAFPVFHALRQRFPQARISWLIRPDCTGILETLCGLDEIIAFDRQRFSRFGRSFTVTREFFSYLKQLRQKRFDLVLDLQGLFRSGFLSRATAAGVRLGPANAREGATIFYTHKIPIPAGEHIVESLWRFAEMFDVTAECKVFDVNIDPQAKKRAQELLSKSNVPDQKYAVLLIGGTEAAKRWPMKRYAQLADWLKQRYDLPSLLLGAGQTEHTLADQVVRQSRCGVVNLVGQTNLQELLSILESSKLVIGNDSGPLHLAAAVDVVLIGLYGPTNPAIVGPFGHLDWVIEAGKGIERQHRYSEHPEHRIDAISFETVAQTIERQLEH